MTMIDLDERAQKQLDKLDAIITINEAAVFLRVHELTVYRLIHAGELAAYKDDGGTWCLTRSDIIEYCNAHAN